MTYTTTYSLATARSRFAANTYTMGNQTFTDLAPLATGGFVVGYGTVLDFFGSNYASTHHYVVAEGDVRDIAAQDNGNVAVLAGDGTDDHVQFFDSTGHKVGATIDIGATGTSATILVLHNNNIVITYSYASTGESSRIYTDEYDSTGHLVNTNQVDSGSADNYYKYGITTTLADGGFVITYSEHISDYQYDIRGSVFNADGSVRNADHAFVGVGSDSTYFVQEMVGLDDGGFAIVYKYIDPDPSGFFNEEEEVVLRTYNASGVEVGSPRVLAHDDGSDYGTFYDIQISKLGNGFIAVSWLRNLDDDGGSDQYLTIFDETASPVGLPTNVVLAHYAEGDFANPDVSALIAGDLFFAQTDPTIDGSGTGIAVTVRELTRTSIGTSGADPFLGDDLSDKVYAGGGADLVTGLGGRDFLYGEAGEDFINGGVGGDYLYGGTENDTVIGDTGDDFVSGDEGDDQVSGDAGNDLVLGGTENDNVSGGDGDDSLFGEAGTDALYGGAGVDRLDGGTGVDTLTGGLGNDTYVLADFHSAGGLPTRYVFDTVVEDRGRGTGTDTVLVAAIVNKFAPSGYTLGDNVENGIVTGVDTFTLTGNRQDNALTGNDAANTLAGLRGDDVLSGLGGNDTLNGGVDFDHLDGGLGDDTFVLNDVTTRTDLGTRVYDIVTETVGIGGGVDTVLIQAFSNGGYKLTANVENGTITGTGPFQLEGNALANTLIGNRDDSRLIGGAGADRLTGGAGNDSFIYQDLIAGTGGGWGNDIVTDFDRGRDIVSFQRTSDITKFKDLTITDHNGNALISTGHGDTIELLGVAATDLRARDFQFVPAAAVASPAQPGLGEHLAHDWLGAATGNHFWSSDLVALV